MRHSVNGRTQNLFPSERRYLMRNKIHTLESDQCACWDQKGWEEHRTKLMIFKQAAEKAKQSCGFCRSDSWKANTATCSVETLAEVSPLHCEITRPQLTVFSPAWEYEYVCVWLHSPLCRATHTWLKGK